MKQLKIGTVTVIGANGTMGKNVSAIFAAFGKAKVYMISRDLAKSEEAIEKAYQSVRAESIKQNMYPADYTMLEQCVAESDLVFESTAEDWDVKENITKRVALAASKHFKQCIDTVFCSGTSGLSLTKLAECFPPNLQGNYFGMHFFNPPYVMTLCEMTPTKYTKRNIFDSVVDYCKATLNRTAVEVKDSPAFLGNRIGFQFINESMQYAERYKYSGGIDYIDAILGGFTGRNMAPLATANFVGLDIHKAIVDNIYTNTNDFAHDSFILPDFAKQLIKEGKFGKKSGAGLYKTILHDSGVKMQQVYDIEHGTYRDVMKYTFPFVEDMIKALKEGDYGNAFQELKNNHSIEADLCVALLLKYILYSLKTTEFVGYDIHSADDVMATGFNWCPPLALIQALCCDKGIEGNLGQTVREFEKLCVARVDSKVLSSIEFKTLLEKIELSRYDFRKFIKAIR